MCTNIIYIYIYLNEWPQHSRTYYRCHLVSNHEVHNNTLHFSSCSAHFVVLVVNDPITDKLYILKRRNGALLVNWMVGTSTKSFLIRNMNRASGALKWLPYFVDLVLSVDG